MRSPFNFSIVTGVPRWTLDKGIQALFQNRRIHRPVFGAVVTPDFSQGDLCLIVASGAGAFTIAAPLNDPGGEGAEFCIMIANTSGGALGAVTFNAIYHTAAGIAFPANGQTRTFDFYRVAGLAGNTTGSWIQDMNTADTPNAT